MKRPFLKYVYYLTSFFLAVTFSTPCQYSKPNTFFFKLRVLRIIYNLVIGAIMVIQVALV